MNTQTENNYFDLMYSDRVHFKTIYKDEENPF